VATVVTVVTVILLAASVALSSQLLSLAAGLPEYKTNVVEKVRTVVGGSLSTGIVTRAIDAVQSYQTMIENELKLGNAGTPVSSTEPNAKVTDPNTKVVVAKTADQSASLPWSELSILAAPLTQAALTFLFSLFLLLQYKDLRDRIVRVEEAVVARRLVVVEDHLAVQLLELAHPRFFFTLWRPSTSLSTSSGME